MDEILFLTLGGLRIGAVYALAALGLVLIHKATGIVNFAHGAFIMLGAYAAVFLLEFCHMPYWSIYFLAPIVVAILAMMLDRLLLRELRRADAFSVILSTIFLSIALSECVRAAYRSELLAMPTFWEGPPFLIGDLIVTRETIWVLAGALASSLIGFAIFTYASIGRSMRAVAASTRGAQLCGFNVDRVNQLAWFIGGALAGLAGVLVAPLTGVGPELAAASILPAFVAAIVGGFDSLGGALLGGLVLGLLETFTAAYISTASSTAATLLLLLAVLLVRPQGLFAGRQTRHV